MENKMKKLFCLIIGLTMTCEIVREGNFTYIPILRCENEEVVCYVGGGDTNPLFCKFKEQN